MLAIGVGCTSIASTAGRAGGFLGGPPNLKTEVLREISGPRLERTNRPLSERKLKVVHTIS